jgi:hypothetical protein
MKLLKLSLLVALVFSFTACDDETDTCIESNWVGNYTGTQDCDGTLEDVTVTITAGSGDSIIIKTESAGLTTTFDPMMFEACSLSSTVTENGVTATTTASIISSSILSIKEVYTGNGSTTTCTISATRD